MSDEVVNRLTKKLEAVRRRDTTLAVFGAGPPFGHAYETHPVTNDQIVEREAALGFAVPEEYRTWLANVGWGAGPDYGLFALEKVDRLFLDEESGIGGEVDDATEIRAAHVAAIQGRWKLSGKNSALGISVNSDRHLLVISESGCGAYTVIVTHGPLRGKIFGLSSEIQIPNTALCALLPEGAFSWSGKGRGPDDLTVLPDRLFGFFDWYEHWLDKILAQPQGFERHLRPKPPGFLARILSKF